MFYGGSQFYFTLFEDVEVEAEVVLRWLKKIGPDNAASLRDIALVYSRKKDLKCMERELIPEMSRAGVKATVKLVRLRHPFCRCARCVLAALYEEDGEEEVEQVEQATFEWPDDVF